MTTQPRLAHGSQVLALMSGTVVAQVLMALALVLAARWGTPAELGAALTWISASSAITGLTDLGLDNKVTVEVATGKMGMAEASQRLVLRLMAAGLSVLVVAVCSVALGADLVNATALIVGPVALAAQIQTVPLRSGGYSERIGLAQLLDRLTLLLVFAALMGCGLGLTLSLQIAYLAGALVNFGVLRRRTPRPLRITAPTQLELPWRQTEGFALFSLATSAQSFDIALIQGTMGSPAAGLYSAVSKWTAAFSVATHAFAGTAVYHFAKARNWRIALLSIARSSWILGVLALACLVLLFGADIIVRIAIGPAYSESAKVLRILCVATIIAILNQPFAAMLMTRGQHVSVARSTVAGICLQGVTILLAAVYAPQGVYQDWAAAGFLLMQLCCLAGFLVSLTLLDRKERHS